MALPTPALAPDYSVFYAIDPGPVAECPRLAPKRRRRARLAKKLYMRAHAKHVRDGAQARNYDDYARAVELEHGIWARVATSDPPWYGDLGTWIAPEAS